jgi:hypothetical protein
VLVVVVPVPVAVVDVLLSVPVCVVAAVVELTVALVLLLSSRPKISSAARKPTASESTATSHVLAPLRSIAAAR